MQTVSFLNYVIISAGSQGHTDSIYVYLIQAFGKLSHSILLHKFNNFLLSKLYINVFESYLCI
jgi:hypothetical protein